MAKLVVMHDEDPAIGIVLEKVLSSTGSMIGWRGQCTQCSVPVFRAGEKVAIEVAQRHVDGHESAL